jgi:hypothetical protein
MTMKFLSIAFIYAFILSSAKSKDTDSSSSLDEFTYSPTAIDNALPTFAPTKVDYYPPSYNVTDDCGNGICDEGENCLSCAVDCISGTSGGSECGNGVCEDGETCYTCPQDCMSSESTSGGKSDDGFCCYGGKKNPKVDDAVSCKDFRCSPFGIACSQEESPFVKYCCGDQVCSGEETSLNCPIDGCKELCGDGKCEESEGENADTCPSDCACNLDGKCDSHETIGACPLDCTCGNYVCDVGLGENVANCMQDCACDANYSCDPWEDAEHCPTDCGPKAMFGHGEGHDANDGEDGTNQQYDGSYGYGDMNSGSDDSSSSDSDCLDNDKPCVSHGDCCSYACDTGAVEPICVG